MTKASNSALFQEHGKTNLKDKDTSKPLGAYEPISTATLACGQAIEGDAPFPIFNFLSFFTRQFIKVLAYGVTVMMSNSHISVTTSYPPIHKRTR